MFIADRQFDSFAAWYKSGPNSRYMRVEHSASDLLSVAELAEPAGRYFSPPLQGLSVFQARSSGGFSRFDIGAGALSEVSYKGGEFTVVRPGVRSEVVFKEDHLFRTFNLPMKVLGPLFEEAGLGSEAIDFGPLHRGMVDSQGVGAALDLLWDEASEACPIGRLAAECAVVSVGTTLLRTMRRLEKTREPPPLRPCDWRLRWVMEQMDSRPSEDISLAELASSIGLSQTHLNTLFRSATGLPPYQWLLGRRLQRAQAMLAETKLTITEIALSCGFASSQHLATMFKKNIGATPSEFRSECRR